MNFRHVLFPLTAVFIWALNISVNKLAADAIDPAAISFYRWLLAGIVLGLFSGPSIWRDRQRIRAVLPKLFTLGLLGMVMFQCLAYVAAQTTSATNMGIITSLVPLLAVVMSIALLGEIATWGGVLGGILSLLGLAYLLSHGQPSSLLENGLVLGDGLMLVGAVCYAGYSVLLKRWAISLGTWQSLTVQIWSILPLLLAYYLYQGAPPITRAGLPLVAFAGIFASMLAPYLWMQGVAKLGPTRTATLINLLPIFSAVIALVFLDEHIHTYHWVGGGIALLGVILAQLLKRPLEA